MTTDGKSDSTTDSATTDSKSDSKSDSAKSSESSYSVSTAVAGVSAHTEIQYGDGTNTAGAYYDANGKKIISWINFEESTDLILSILFLFYAFYVILLNSNNCNIHTIYDNEL